MADITYEREFEHQPWQAGDLVQAEGEDGFNQRFDGIINEFDKIATSVVVDINNRFDEVEEEIEEIRAQPNLGFQPVITLSRQLSPGQITNPEEIDVYNTSDFPAGIRKVYQVSIEPSPGAHGQVSYNLIYEQVPVGGQTTVSIWFKNERDELTRISVQIFALS